VGFFRAVMFCFFQFLYSYSSFQDNDFAIFRGYVACFLFQFDLFPYKLCIYFFSATPYNSSLGRSSSVGIVLRWVRSGSLRFGRPSGYSSAGALVRSAGRDEHSWFILSSFFSPSFVLFSQI